MESTSSGDAEVARKHHMALSTPREKMLTTALDVSRADGSKMDRGIALEAREREGQQEEAEGPPPHPVVPRHHFEERIRDV